MVDVANVFSTLPAAPISGYTLMIPCGGGRFFGEDSIHPVMVLRLKIDADFNLPQVSKIIPENTTNKIAPFLTIVGVDTTFLAVQAAAIRQIVSCFS